MTALESGPLLLEKAREDYAVLEELAECRRIADSVLGFHAQQAVEKLLKAVIAFLGVEYPRTHDLAYLIVLAADAGYPLPAECTDLDVLSVWAVEYRYGRPIEAGPLDRSEVLAKVGTALRWAAEIVEGKAGG